MRIDIVVVSDNDKQFGSAIDEYTKRLGNMVTVHTIKPIKHGPVEQIKTKETELLRAKCEQLSAKQECFAVLLSHRGPSLPSEEFAVMVGKHERIIFLIGGPYGVQESLLEATINKKMSFGKQTMPHGLVKLVLLEQVWRAHTILINKKYHY